MEVRHPGPAWDGVGFWYSPPYRVPTVHITGAGDLFHAGSSYGILCGWDLQRVLDFSCAAAGLNCAALGARGGIRSLREIEALRRNGNCRVPLYSNAQLELAAKDAIRLDQLWRSKNLKTERQEKGI